MIIFNVLQLFIIFNIALSCTYVGVVYEHQIISKIKKYTPKQIIQLNLNVYEKQIKRAASQNAKIIVFPEYGLTGFFEDRSLMFQFLEEIPDVKEEKMNLCNENFHNSSLILYTLSCLAQKYNIYIVFNMGERAYSKYRNLNIKVKIPPIYVNICNYPDQNLHIKNYNNTLRQYNTNVVMDNKGFLIAKYRKCHLCGEPNYDTPEQCDMVTFNTDFAGKFGIFTCFDINFKYPAVDLIEKLGVRNIVFPTMWPDLVPYLTAIAVQSSFAIRMNVNFLAANTKVIKRWGEHGSGIYSGKQGALNYVNDYDTKDGGHFLLAEIPCTPEEARSESNDYNNNNNINLYRSQVIKFHDHYGLDHQSKIGIIPSNQVSRPEITIDEIEIIAARGNDSQHIYTQLEVDGHFRLRQAYSSIRSDFDQLQPPEYPTYNNFNVMWDEDNVDYKIIPSPPTSKDTAAPYDYNITRRETVCHGELCCYLAYRFAAPEDRNDFNSPSTRQDGVLIFAAYNGKHVDFVDWYLQICAFNQCPDENVKSCGSYGRRATHSFAYFEIHGNFSFALANAPVHVENVDDIPNTIDLDDSSINEGLDTELSLHLQEPPLEPKNNLTYVFPFVLADGADLVCKCEWEFILSNNTIRTNTNHGFSEKVLTVALWGRNYDLD